MNQKKNILIAGGGTGGHIYPAVAIAREILKLDPEVEITFVGSASGLETKIIPKEKFNLLLLPVGKLNYKGGVLEKIKTLFKLPVALIKSGLIVFKYKPIAVLGVGGYASGPFVLVASLLGRNTFLWEPNAFPGMTNRWLSRFVKKCLVVFSEARKVLGEKKSEQVGLPVREEIENLFKLEYRKPATPFKILIFGGSQGARAINNAFCESVLKNKSWLEGFEVIHQTGSTDHKAIVEKYKTVSAPQVTVTEFIYDMHEKYKWADLVICRSGASTVAELSAAKKAGLLIPLPSAADDHQYKNAKVLVDANAAWLIEQKDLTPESLIEKVTEIRNNKEKLELMSEKVGHFFVSQAAKKTAEIILGKRN